jgi:hypothetical protein
VEPFKGWESLDTELFGNLLVFGGIKLGDKERWVVLGEGLGSGNILWDEFLAVTTPWGIKFD